MVLIRVSEGGKPANVGQLQNRGDIVHKLVNSNANIPLVMQDLAEPKAKVGINWCSKISTRIQQKEWNSS